MDRAPGLRIGPVLADGEHGGAGGAVEGRLDPPRGHRQQAAEAGPVGVQAGGGARDGAGAGGAFARAGLAQVRHQRGEGGLLRRGGAVPGGQRGHGARQHRRDLGIRQAAPQEGADRRDEAQQQEQHQRRGQQQGGQARGAVHAWLRGGQACWIMP